MPPRVPWSTRTLQRLLEEPYTCPSCLGKASTKPTSKTPVPFVERNRRRFTVVAKASIRPHAGKRTVVHTERATRRRASNGSLASATAINAPASVPASLRPLHQQLTALQDQASSYVDLARLQLATRSLEGDPPVVRVALLGLGSNGPSAARKLARVLLSDALADEAAWEKEILKSLEDGRSLLIRYGDEGDTVQSNPLVKTLNAPSPYLRRHNVEILVAALNLSSDAVSSESLSSLQDAIIVPSLTTQNSTGGRVGFVRFPVHKSVLVAEGITGAVQYGSLPQGVTDGQLITAALSVPLRPSTAGQSAEVEASTNSIDIDLADHALGLFRTDKANGAQFSREWQTSRVSELGQWIAGSNDSTTDSVNPAVRNLISSVLMNTNQSVSRADELAYTTQTAATVPQAKRDDLQSAVTDWSAESHRDLQLNLDTAFSSSQSWQRTSWWRLFWRIDDVTVSAADVLRRSWLTESEQGLAFLSGRIAEAGLATSQQLRSATPQLLDDYSQVDMRVHGVVKEQRDAVAELFQLPSMLAQMKDQSGVNAQFSPPWPQNIDLSRQFMVHTLVPDLHRKAQALLLTTISTIGGSAALGGWFYLATGGVGLYESGAILALGLVWSLRRLQKKWGIERDGFASVVREDARRVVGEVEGHLRKLVNEGGRPTAREEDARSRREVKDAVQRCQDALERLKQS